MDKSTIYVDLDGTLCPVRQEHERYADLPAHQEMVERLTEAQAEGFRIVVYTARNMRTYGGDPAYLHAMTVPSVLEWLRRHKVPFDGLVVGKPWPGPKGFYVDDRAVRPAEFASLSTEAIHTLLSRTKGEVHD